MKHKTILNYQAVFQKEPTGGYAVWIPELPGCASQGSTLDEAKSNIEEAIQLYLEDAPRDVVREAQSPKEQFFVPISIPFVYG